MRYHTAFINLLIGEQITKVISSLESSGYEVYSGFDGDECDLSSVLAWSKNDHHIQMVVIKIAHNSGEDCEAVASKLNLILNELNISHCGIMVAKEPLSFAIMQPNITIGQRKELRALPIKNKMINHLALVKPVSISNDQIKTEN